MNDIFSVKFSCTSVHLKIFIIEIAEINKRLFGFPNRLMVNHQAEMWKHP